MWFLKSLRRGYQPKLGKKQSAKKIKQITCPNCGRKVVKDESGSCPWCHFPLA
ncbi:hypothetical protein ACFLWN_00050 [Chloroflexota bacterium]